MTLILQGGLDSIIVGKQGGTIFSKNHAGSITKAYARPINRQSSTQQPNRVNWGYIIRYWQLLPQVNIANWNSLALTVTWHNKVGTAYHPTGQQLYLYCNQNLYTIGLPVLLNPVAPTGRTLISEASIQENLIVTYAMNLIFYPTPTNDFICYKLYATQGLSAGISYAKKWLKHLINLPPGSSAPFDITVAYIARFGQPVAGTKIFFKLVPVEINTGFSGTPVFFSFIAGKFIPSLPIYPVMFGISF